MGKTACCTSLSTCLKVGCLSAVRLDGGRAGGFHFFTAELLATDRFKDRRHYFSVYILMTLPGPTDNTSPVVTQTKSLVGERDWRFKGETNQ